PTQIIDAWIHLILGLVSFQRDSERSERLIYDARRSAAEGANIIISSLSAKSLMENSVILPLEIFSLISLKLIQSVPNVLDLHSDRERASSNIAQIYRNCLDEIEADLSRKPSDRANEENLKLVGEEIQAIQQTLYQQDGVFSTLLRDAIDSTTSKEKPIYYSAGRPSEPTTTESLFKISPTDPGGYRKLLLDECYSKSALLQHEPRQLEFRCSDLREKTSLFPPSNIPDTTKFRQDKAIYASTIVTTIFLPLSAISSIFGMNTADIRDMESGQWIYWATAVLVTLAVILLGLIWMGELGNPFQWVFWGLGAWVFRRMAGDREKGREIVDNWFGRIRFR
ncbi:hypothetical protein QBC36DRAFT_199299, partial [Triangularia setosa]